MRASTSLALLAAVGLSGVGCTSLQYEEKRADGGTISFKASEREAALAKLKQDYGDVSIVAEYDAKQAAKPGGVFDPNAPVRPSERLAVNSGIGSLAGKGDDSRVQLQFVAKKPVTQPAQAVTQPDSGVVQAGFQTKSSYDRTPSGTELPKPDLSGIGGN